MVRIRSADCGGRVSPAVDAVERLEAVIGGQSLPRFNNRQETVEPVLAAFDRAIAFGNVVAAES